MGYAQFVVFCERQLVDTAIQLILDADSRINVASSRTFSCETIEETTDVYILHRGREQAEVAIIVGDRESQVGPFDGEYWIYVIGMPASFFDHNEPFAKELKAILIAHGARETRKQDAHDT